MSDIASPASVTELQRVAARVALVGPGRAGTTIAAALAGRGSRVVAVAGRAGASSTTVTARLLDAEPRAVAVVGTGADLVLLAVPDDAIADVAAALAGSTEPGALVVHLSGARGLDALAPLASSRPDVRVGALHPLQSFPSPARSVTEARQRLVGAWAAVAGAPDVRRVAAALGLRPFTLADRDRATYHAAACVASNHLVALLGQVERLASAAGVPVQAFTPLARAALEHAVREGASAALTGPVARGDAGTVARHLDALAPGEAEAYLALAREAARLSGTRDPGLAALLTPVPEGQCT